jgi:hypothetical protein
MSRVKKFFMFFDPPADNELSGQIGSYLLRSDRHDTAFSPISFLSACKVAKQGGGLTPPFHQFHSLAHARWRLDTAFSPTSFLSACKVAKQGGVEPHALQGAFGTAAEPQRSRFLRCPRVTPLPGIILGLFAIGY